MFNLGFALLFVVFVSCNCYDDSQAEDSERQEDMISEERTRLTEPSERDDEDIAEDDGVDGDDDTLIDVSEKEG